MIIPLEEALGINPKATQDDLDGLEQMIRGLTQNNFFNPYAQGLVGKLENNQIHLVSLAEGIEVGDTVGIHGSRFNDGLYEVMGVQGRDISIGGRFKAETAQGGSQSPRVYLVEYPADIVRGVRELLRYDAKMADKVGIASEKISRWTVSYNVGGDSEGGYPKELMQFLDPYRKLRW
ncbi:MAG: hypothetical protein FWF59_08475 [Turicibacter sp.]|nr:hypothetical protein [Turicibacter sp.]